MKAYRMIVLGGTLLLSLLVVLAAQANRETPGQPQQPAVGEYAYVPENIPATPNADWINRADLPIPIGYQGADTIGEKIYQAGGNTSTGPTDTLFSYDPVSDSWQTLASMPSARGYPGAIAEGGKLYVAGGETNANDKLGDLYAYTPGINTWDKLADMPALRAHGGMASWQGKLYFVGGMDENNINQATVYEYDIETNTWRLLTMLPEARRGAGAAVVNGILYVVGGATPAEEASNIVWGYNLTLNSWSVKAPLPVAKWDLGYSTKSYQGKVYVVGGYTGAVMVRDVEVYDPLTDTWQMLPDLPKERTGIAAALINGELHAIGGYSFVYGTMGDHTALQVLSVKLIPSEQLLNGNRGDTLHFEETLSNNTGITDTIQLKMGGSQWPAVLSDDSIALGNGEQITFTVDVTIPADAGWSVLNTIVVTATSSVSPTIYFDTAVLNVQMSPPPPLYLPMIIKPQPGLGGTVLMDGAPASGVSLDLRFYDGASWTTKTSTTTGDDGSYFFGDMPALASGQSYYVRYLNNSDDSRLYTWHTAVDKSYNGSSVVTFETFDIANIVLSSPEPGAAVKLPATFTWVMRPASPTDSYEFNLFDPNSDLEFYTDPPLGYVSSYRLSALPQGFSKGVEYGWGMGVVSPAGGYGMSFYYNPIMFK